MKKAKISYHDTVELQRFLTGSSDDAEDEQIEQDFYEKFGIGFEELDLLIEYLLPLCEHSKSPLTDNEYRGFADVESGSWIVKSLEPK